MIANNLVFGNTCGDNGAGIYCSNHTPLWIQNNTIVDNVAGGTGGGVHSRWSSTVEVVNCILWNNSAPLGPELAIEDSGVLLVHHSDVQGGQEAAYIGSGSLNWGDNNLTANPVFVSSIENNYHLAPGSPCIDAGIFLAAVTDDFEGDLRGFDGTAEPRGDGSDFDMGADEYVAVAVADAGDDFFGYESLSTSGYICELDATRSSGALTYLWEQVTGISVELFDAQTETPEFYAPQWDGSTEFSKSQARLRFRLTINHGEANEDTDEVEVYIRIPGDATGDDIINAFDLARFRQLDPYADFNGDGRVNAFDVSILRLNSGRRRTVE